MTELTRNYIESMRAHTEEGGQLSHRNGLDLLAEVERLQNPWLPIETAPRDGTHIMVATFPEAPGTITRTTAHWFDAGWALSVNYDGDHSDHGVRSPTHWASIPLSRPNREAPDA